MSRIFNNQQFLILILILIFGIKSSFAQYDIIAHRGASYIAPENTVASAKLAWELNADAVEVDVYLTKDKRIVVIHDETTKRIAANNENYTIAETNSEVLRKLDVGSWKDEKYKGEKIPFLTEIIALTPPNKKLVVEIKCGKEIVPYLLKILDNNSKLVQISFISFDWDVIIATKKAFPENKCYWLSSSAADVYTKLPIVGKNQLDGINLYYGIISKGLVFKSKALGLDVLSWTVDDPLIAYNLIDIGVIGITTNRPGWMKKSLEIFDKEK